VITPEFLQKGAPLQISKDACQSRVRGSAEHEPDRCRDDQRRTWVVLDHAFDVRRHALRILVAHVVGNRAQPFWGRMSELLDPR
jgi:hypothetical protein